MLNAFVFFLWFGTTGCTPEPTACEQLQDEVCACEGEAADYNCGLRTEQAEEADRRLDDDDTEGFDDAQEVCSEVYEAFIDAGGCGSLVTPESSAQNDT